MRGASLPATSYYCTQPLTMFTTDAELPTMPSEPKPTDKTPRPKPKADGFVVFEVDGFRQLTPEQREWPVVDPVPAAPPNPDPGKGSPPG